MKNLKFILYILLTTLVIQGCEKKESEEVIDDCQISMNIDGKNYNSILIENFESISNVDEWNLSQEGNIILDSENTFKGTNSIKLTAFDGCFSLERKKGVNIKKDKIYVIHFNYKMIPIQVGDYGYCVGSFVFRLKQGDQEIYRGYVSGSPDWTDKYFYFKPNNDIPIQLEMFVGTTRGLWLDGFTIFEEN